MDNVDQRSRSRVRQHRSENSVHLYRIHATVYTILKCHRKHYL